MEQTPTPLIRCRLSDGYADAEELTARDGASLAAACARAYERYVERHPAGAPRLEIQVRPLASAGDGWFAPVRPHANPSALGAPVRVFVTRDLLDRRSPDDWNEIWTWVQHSRAGDRAVGGFADRVAGCLTEQPGTDQ